MISSTFLTGVFGLSATLFPKIILSIAEVNSNWFLILIVQIAGILYLGFSIMNWIAKSALNGSVYTRLLLKGNLFHFTVTALVLFKTAIGNHYSDYILSAAILYSMFAILFGFALLTNTNKKASHNGSIKNLHIILSERSVNNYRQR